MQEQELRELQDPATWDDKSDEILQPARSPRAVVSVAFGKEDFARVAQHARESGMKTSEFIRLATLDRVAKGHRRKSGVTVSITSCRGDIQRNASLVNEQGNGLPAFHRYFAGVKATGT
ncbi:MAG: hypothetical protein ACRDJW_21270 [Thermomicrobiales bacterium]